MITMHQLLSDLFSLACGQYPAHTSAMGGVWLPCCQRCTGLYGGAGVALALHLLWRPGLSSGFLAVHGLFLMIVAPFGFHWLPQGPVLRMLTGVLCGFGVATFLWVVPANHRAGESGPASTKALWWYGIGLVATLTLLPLTESCGGRITYWALSAAAAMGLFSLAALVLLNVGLACMECRMQAGVRHRRRDGH